MKTSQKFRNVELNPIQDWNDNKNINSSWRGYEVYMILEQFKNDNFVNRLFGHGFGSYIYSESGIMYENEIIHEIPIFDGLKIFC